MWVLKATGNGFEHRHIKFITGLYKIFDEILVNAADNYHRDAKTTRIDVNVDEGTGVITVLNDGKSIPVQVHKEHKIYVAELVFGHLLTSSNYEDGKKKITGGRNGYGAKLTNIFSSYFRIETADSDSRKLLTIEWRDNMSKMSIPETMVYNGNNYTKVTFKPDYQKFGVAGLSPDMVGVFKKRVWDLAGLLKCAVFLNEELVNIHSFLQYVKLYSKNEENEELIYDNDADGKRWKVVLTKSEGQFQQVSFVNSICTANGGTHVAYICDQIVEKLIPLLNKKVKDLTIKPFQVKSHLQLFLSCSIENPSFTSQTKDTLTSNPTTFGSIYTVSDKFIKELTKSGILERILSHLRTK
jgi:DNA topoisomerase-2